MSAVVCRPSSRSDTSRRRQPVTAPPAADHWSAARDATGTRIYHVRVFELRTEVSRLVGQRCADSAWRGIWELLREQERHGRTDTIRRLAAQHCVLDDVGVAGLARHTGKSRNTITRQLAVLEDLGLVKVVRPPVTLRRGVDGKLTANRIGRQTAVRIVITADPARHGKPRSKAAAAAEKAAGTGSVYGQPLSIPGASEGGFYGQPLSSIPVSLNTSELLPPAADTVGVGAAEADGQAGRLTPAETAGLTAGTSEGEAGTPFTMADVMDEATAGILASRPGWPTPADPPHVAKHPARKHRRKRRQPIPFFQLDEAPEPTPAERAANSSDEWHRGVERQRQAAADREAARMAWKASTPAEPTPEPPPPAPASDDDLAALVCGRRQAARDAASAKHRDAWRQERGLPQSTGKAGTGDVIRCGERTKAEVLAELHAYARRHG